MKNLSKYSDETIQSIIDNQVLNIYEHVGKVKCSKCSLSVNKSTIHSLSFYDTIDPYLGVKMKYQVLCDAGHKSYGNVLLLDELIKNYTNGEIKTNHRSE